MSTPSSLLSGAFFLLASCVYIASLAYCAARTEKGKEIYRLSSHTAVILILVVIVFALWDIAHLLGK